MVDLGRVKCKYGPERGPSVTRKIFRVIQYGFEKKKNVRKKYVFFTIFYSTRNKFNFPPCKRTQMTVLFYRRFFIFHSIRIIVSR